MNSNEKPQKDKAGAGAFGRRATALRKLIVDHVSEQDIRDIMEAMKVKARKGSLSAAKLVMAYSAGRPARRRSG